MPTTLPNQSHPCPSVRVDWLSASFRLHHPGDGEDLVDYLDGIAATVMPKGQWTDPVPGRFFATKVRHQSGIQVQYTDPDEIRMLRRSPNDPKLSNPGLCSIEIPGSVWGYLSVENRRQLITEMRGWPGFVRTTRLDLQATLLEADEDAEWIVREVAAGRLWPKGFGVGMAFAYRNLHGDLHGACTQYFGGKASRVRSRHYDKAAEAGWDVPAVRHEVQLREEPADQWFRRLADRCQTQESVGPLMMDAEASTVKDALGTLVDFRDTSRWEGRPKPKKWAQTAKVPGWWRDVIGPSPVPLAVEYRPPGDLEASRAAWEDQYGRSMGLWALLEVTKGSQELPEVALDLLLRCMARVDEGDWKRIHQLVPGADPVVMREWVGRYRARALARVADLDGSEDPAPPC